MLTAITVGILWGAFLVTGAWMLSRKIVSGLRKGTGSREGLTGGRSTEQVGHQSGTHNDIARHGEPR